MTDVKSIKYRTNIAQEVRTLISPETKIASFSVYMRPRIKRIYLCWYGFVSLTLNWRTIHSPRNRGL